MNENFDGGKSRKVASVFGAVGASASVLAGEQDQANVTLRASARLESLG